MFFLTLTVKNVASQDLKDELRNLTKGFDRLFKRAKVKKNLIGYMRATEVTYNSETKEYHPHLHILLMVKSTYFKGKGNLYRAGRMDGSMATINAVILYSCCEC